MDIASTDRRAHHRLVRLTWDASPWLLVPVPFLAAPAAYLWIAGGVAGRRRRRSALFAFLGGELGIADWTIDARLRVPRPPSRVIDALAATLLVLTTLLVLAMAAHGISG